MGLRCSKCWTEKLVGDKVVEGLQTTKKGQIALKKAKDG